MAAFFLNFLLVVASDFQEKAILLFVYHAQDGLAEGFFPWEGKHLHYVIDRPQADLHLLVVGLAHSIERGLLKVVKRHAATLRKNTAYVSRASRCTSPSFFFTQRTFQKQPPCESTAITNFRRWLHVCASKAHHFGTTPQRWWLLAWLNSPHACNRKSTRGSDEASSRFTQVGAMTNTHALNHCAALYSEERAAAPSAWQLSRMTAYQDPGVA